MIITNGQLRPPSPKELKDQRLILERIALSWTIDYDASVCIPEDDPLKCDCPEVIGHVWSSGTFALTTLELIEFHKDHAIPYEARLEAVGDDNDLQLDWTHLVHCPVCQQWYEKGTDHANDTLHTAVEAGTARAPEEKS